MIADQGHIKLLGERRSGESLVVACHEYVDFVSHGTTLVDCTVEIRGSSRGIVFHGATLEQCVVHAKKEMTNYRWHDVKLTRCKFRGRYLGCDFGSRPDIYPDHPIGSAVDCDFSSAKLHLCRFFNCEMSRIQLPAWPCITILEPEKNCADWLAIKMPQELRITQQTVGETAKGEVAFVVDAEKWCRKCGVPVDAVRELVSAKSYVVM
jgi:hypothetical protein